MKTKIKTLWRKRFSETSFDDPRPIAKDAPYTFYLPPEKYFATVAKGDLVKLLFREVRGKYQYGCERMWVKVTQRDGDNLEGTLNNTPYDMPHLTFGDTVKFEIFHIIDIDWDEAALSERNLTKGTSKQIWERCCVDDLVLDGTVKVEYIYREEPNMTQEGDKHEDSGWRIRGDVRNMTDDQYENGTASYIALGKVLNQDDSWIHLIDSPVGSAFLKNWETGEFEPTEISPPDEA